MTDPDTGAVVGPSATPAGTLLSGSAWSTIKVPIALTLLRGAGGPTALSAAHLRQIDLALTASDNPAAAALFASLGPVDAAAAAVTATLRATGDETTVVSTRGRDGWSPYGQTDWSLAEQHRFMTALLAASDPGARHVLDLMGRVRSDRWGLGAVGATLWKGGWGPEADGSYLVRQMGVLDGAVVAIMARAADGRYVTGQRLATELARSL